MNNMDIHKPHPLSISPLLHLIRGKSLLRSLLRRSLTSILLRDRVANQQTLSVLYDDYCQATVAGSLAVDLGSGVFPRNPFRCHKSIGIDLKKSSDVMSHDLSTGSIPLPDVSVSVVTAFDFLEHVPRVLPSHAGSNSLSIRFPFVELLNETHRILAPGGLFFSITPAYPWPMAFSDPTHVNTITEETMANYFCLPALWARLYGFDGAFERLDGFWIDCHHVSLMRKHVAP